MKKKLLIIAVGLALAATACLPFSAIPEASAYFTHPWSVHGSGGLGSNPAGNKECGLWSSAPGSTTTGQKCAVFWIELDNGGSGGTPTENEWVRYSTTQVDVTPTTGYRVIVRFNLGQHISFKVGVQFSTSTSLVTGLSTASGINQWRTVVFYPSTMMGRIIRVWIEINDYANTYGTPKEVCMVLIDYIRIYSGTSTLLWQEEF